MPLRLMPAESVVRIRSGELQGWRWIAGSSTNGCWLGTYERNMQQLFRERIRPGATVFDVGANVGFFTLLASKLAGDSGRVYAFEPLPRNLDFLDRHLRINEIANVHVKALAIAAASGEAHFRIAQHASMGGLAEGGDLHVVTASLDDLIASGYVTRPDFIKMDIEGAESDALRGAKELLAGRALTIALSTHGWQQHEACWTTLTEAGFKLELLKDGADDGDYLILATK
ncbi:MAG: FkbM family methyltransferase [Acidobacteria bacterium]|nr:FkbM family methyltransferase [Acidobacteriota bacterium]MBV9071330.1 FkbM family methyltransferase [Acidobacteriota bacterium]MBV9188169.1 FkbM family methyltransferase [Acidobacteriota bacterium]